MQINLQPPEGLTSLTEDMTHSRKILHPISEGEISSHFIYMMYVSDLFIQCLYILTHINHLSFLDFLYVCLF